MAHGPSLDPAPSTMTAGERVLAEKAERYRSLFAYSPHGVFSLDVAGRITDANDALQQLSGYSPAELLAVDFYDIVHPSDIEAGKAAFAAVMERRPQVLEARLITAAGEVRELKMTAVPVVVSDQVVGVHGIVEDVTEANAMQRDLVAANAAKTLFLANVSHEVRTPLTMVIAATEMLLDSEMGPTQDRLTGMVHRNSQRLLQLVNDILDFSQLEAGKISLVAAPFSLADVVEDVVEWAQPRAAAGGLTLTTHLGPGLPISACGDGLRVYQLLANLVDNALKFTDAGSVDLTVSLGVPTPHDLETDAVRVRFAVTDTGVGIPSEHLESLFDSFTQADPTATRRHGGVGLGLAICRDLAELMDGELGAVSAPGAGSTFTAELPLVVEDVDVLAAEQRAGVVG